MSWQEIVVLKRFLSGGSEYRGLLDYGLELGRRLLFLELVETWMELWELDGRGLVKARFIYTFWKEHSLQTSSWHPLSVGVLTRKVNILIFRAAELGRQTSLDLFSGLWKPHATSTKWIIRLGKVSGGMRNLYWIYKPKNGEHLPKNMDVRHPERLGQDHTVPYRRNIWASVGFLYSV